jgi:hypothetical protein
VESVFLRWNEDDDDDDNNNNNITHIPYFTAV